MHPYFKLIPPDPGVNSPCPAFLTGSSFSLFEPTSYCGGVNVCACIVTLPGITRSEASGSEGTQSTPPATPIAKRQAKRIGERATAIETRSNLLVTNSCEKRGPNPERREAGKISTGVGLRRKGNSKLESQCGMSYKFISAERLRICILTRTNHSRVCAAINTNIFLEVQNEHQSSGRARGRRPFSHGRH